MRGSFNPAIMSDSYKASHYLMYPDANQMSAFGSFRRSFPDCNDNRFIFYGLRYIIENYVDRKWTKKDVEEAEAFYKTYHAGYTAHPFPKHIFEKFIEEYDGYFPVVIEALPEGTVAYCGTPVYQITAKNEYSTLITFLETLLTMIWYPSTVATLSKLTKEIIRDAFVKSVDEELFYLLDSRLHDFGFRGCTSVEQSIIGGSAHLLNFTGSDTMSASFYIQYHLNNGKPRGSSIPASEHSTMTAWESEVKAFDQITNQFKGSIFSTVMDSYDYDNACNNIVPLFSNRVKEANGLWVLRPDSGDPVEAVLTGLKAAEKAFGCKLNSKGFKVIQNSAVIQGDGIDFKIIRNILDAVLKEGYSAGNCVFGMGGGLLQKVNRDTMSFATKLSHIIYKNGSALDIMKTPKTDMTKVSLPGRLNVCLNNEQKPCTYPEEDSSDKKSLFETVWNCGPVKNHVWKDFDSLIAKIDKEWSNLPNGGTPFSKELKKKIEITVENLRKAKKIN